MKEVKEKKKSKRKYFIGIIILLAIIVVGYFTWSYFFPKREGTPWVPINLTAENLPSYLERLNAIHDLPQDGVIALTIGSSPYTIEKGKVREGLPSSADLSITLPDAYFEIFGQYGWCAGLQIARQRGELGIELGGSETGLLWKYKALAKYKGCLGKQ